MEPSLRSLLRLSLLLAATTTTAAGQDATSACSRHRPSTIYPVHGRCLAAETGEPLASCTIRLTGHQSTGFPLSWSCLDWVDPEPFASGADGRFRFDLALPPSVYPPAYGWTHRIHVEVRHPQRSGWFASCGLPLLVDRGGVDLGDLKLVLGSRPFLNVVDTEGQVQPGTVVRLQLDVPAPEPPRHGLSLYESRYQSACVRSDGRVPLNSPMQPGKWRVTVVNRDIVSGREIVVPPPPQRPVRCQVLLARQDSQERIMGHVVDSNGNAVAGLYVGLADRRELATIQREPGAFQRTEGDGFFVFVREARSPANALLVLGSNRIDPWVRHEPVDWGEDKLRVVLPPALELRLDVVDSEGKPVEDLLVHCVPDAAGGLSEVRTCQRFPGGQVAIPGVRPGAYRLLVFPRQAHVGPSPWLPIDLAANGAPVRVVLPSLVQRAVRVVLASGVAARDVRVDLVATAADRVVAQPWALAYSLGQQGPGRSSPKHDVLLSRGWTDKLGRVTLPGPAASGLELRVSGAAVQNATHEVKAWAAGDEIVIEVEEGACLHGSVRPVDSLAALMPSDTERGHASAYGSAGMLPELAGRRPGLMVRPTQRTQEWAARTFALAPDGSYRIEGLPPGRCVVSFVHWPDHKKRSDPVDLGEVDLRLGEPLRRDFDLPADVGKK